MKTKGNIVLITGGSKGIGLALAKKFHTLGNTVIISSRNKQNLHKAADSLPGVHTIQCDMASSADVDRLAGQAAHCNILVNNAAVQFRSTLGNDEYLAENISTEIETNLTGPIRLIHGMLPQLLQKDRSAIVNVSSGLALAPKRSAPVYCATKAALHNFSVALRYQLEDTPVRVFEIMPPLVDTDMTAGRGNMKKIQPDQLVEEFWLNFTQDKYWSKIGKVKLLYWLLRIWPKMGKQILKNS